MSAMYTIALGGKQENLVSAACWQETAQSTACSYPLNPSS